MKTPNNMSVVRRVSGLTALLTVAGASLALPSVQALPAPDPVSCADVAIVEAGTTINCIVAAGETVEFTAVAGHGGAGGRGGFGGAGLSVDFDGTFLLGGFGGSGGFGGAGGAGRMATGSYTNETGDPVTLTIEVGNNGAVGADGADGADGTAEQPFGEVGQDGQDGAKGGAAFIIVGSGLGPNQIGALDVQYLVEVEGGAGGLGGQGGLGGTPADTENSLPGEDGADGALGLPGADGTISPDPLPDGWTTGYSDGTPRVILSVVSPDPDPTPTPTPGAPAPVPAPFQPVLPDLSDVTAGSAPGVIEFSNLPAGAVVSVASDAADSVKGVGSVTIVDGKVTVTPDAGFSGIITLPVTVNIGGTVTTVTLTVTVNPAPAADGSFTPSTGAQWWPSPRAFSGTTVTWTPSGNAVGYEVWIVIPGIPGVLSAQSESRVLLCTATATSCVVDRLVGPNSTLELVATGNDGTRSTTVLPAYRSAEFTRVLNVMFAGNSSRLSATAKAELDLLAFVIAAEGYSEVQISSHISANRVNAFGRKLSRDRADVVAKYLSARVGRTVTVTIVSEANARPVAANDTLAGREANRRAEISVR